MFKKTIRSKKVEALNNTPVKEAQPTGPVKMSAKQRRAYDFPQGVRFLMNGEVYYVRKAFSEMNTQMRQLHGLVSDEIVMLSSLQKEAEEDEDFTVLA
jgi:hypothetical protein